MKSNSIHKISAAVIFWNGTNCFVHMGTGKEKLHKCVLLMDHKSSVDIHANVSLHNVILKRLNLFLTSYKLRQQKTRFGIAWQKFIKMQFQGNFLRFYEWNFFKFVHKSRDFRVNNKSLEHSCSISSNRSQRCFLILFTFFHFFQTLIWRCKQSREKQHFIYCKKSLFSISAHKKLSNHLRVRYQLGSCFKKFHVKLSLNLSSLQEHSRHEWRGCGKKTIHDYSFSLHRRSTGNFLFNFILPHSTEHFLISSRSGLCFNHRCTSALIFFSQS